MTISITGGGEISVNGAPSISLPSSGLVLTPQHRHGFIAGRSSAQSLSPAGTRLIFDTFVYNVGNLYNNTTGVVTAPLSGIYIFNLNALSDNQSAVMNLALYVNNVDTKLFTYNGNWTGHKTSSWHFTYLLNAGDTLDIRSRDGNGTLWGASNQYHSFFGAHFLG